MFQGPVNAHGLVAAVVPVGVHGPVITVGHVVEGLDALVEPVFADLIGCMYRIRISLTQGRAGPADVDRLAVGTF